LPLFKSYITFTISIIKAIKNILKNKNTKTLFIILIIVVIKSNMMIENIDPKSVIHNFLYLYNK